MNDPADTAAADPNPTPATRRIAWLAFWFAVLIAPLVFVAALDALIAARNVPSVPAIVSVEFLASAAAHPRELPATGWQTVSRRHSLRPPPGGASSAWYRLGFDAGAAPDGLWAVYLPRPYANVAVFVNGSLIGDGGPMSPPLPMHRNPLFFTFPSGALRPGANEVELRVVASFGSAGFAPVYVAPAERLEGHYRFGRAMFMTAKQVLLIFMLLVATTMGAIYLLRRRDPAFGWFSLALLFWAAHVGIMLVARAPIESRPLWETGQGIAIGLYSLCAAQFIHRFLGLHRPRLERALLVFALLGSATMLAGPVFFDRVLFEFFGLVWIPVAHAVAIYQLVLLVRAHGRRADPEIRWLIAVSWLVTVVGMRDTLLEAGVAGRGYLYLTYTAAPVVLVFGAILLRRFVTALDASERANEVLEGRVAEKTHELELNLGRLKDLERERALSAERERILQDMHDGIGGHLVQALSIAASRGELAPLEEPLRQCLDELRLMIDSIEPVDGDLASVLGTLRMRMSRRLAQAGVDLRWQIADLPSLPDLGPKHVLEITRIVQEAITNALKHSGARRIRIAARPGAAGESVVIEIGDEGRGFGGAERGEGTGRGLPGMRRRAAALGATLEIASDASGTTVTLRLPTRSRGAVDRQAREHGQAPAARGAHSDVPQ